MSKTTINKTKTRSIKYIFILGPPAVGKTTAARWLKNEITVKGKTCLFLRDNDLQYEICPRGGPGDGKDYNYIGNRLVTKVEAREKILSLWQRRFFDLVRNTRNYNYCLVEFTSPDWRQKLGNEREWLIPAKPILLFINDSIRRIINNNRLRDNHDQVPEDYINLFTNQKKLYLKIRPYFINSTIIYNNGSLASYYGKLNKWFISSFLQFL